MWRIQSIEHSGNKIIVQSGMFENEIGPVMLQSSVRQTQVLQEYQRHKPRATDYVSLLSVLCEMFADFTFVEYWTVALQVQPRCEMCNSFIFGMLCWLVICTQITFEVSHF